MIKVPMIEQHALNVLALSGEAFTVYVVPSPVSVRGDEYALEVICGTDAKRYLMRQKVKRVRNFKTIDAAWAKARKLGVKMVSLVDGNK